MSNQQIKDERRKFKRIPISIPVYIKVKVPGDNDRYIKNIKILNLSEGGIYIYRPQYAVFSLIDIVIPLPDNDTFIYATGIVQFNDSDGIGVKFIKIDSESLNLLQSLIKDTRKKSYKQTKLFSLL